MAEDEPQIVGVESSDTNFTVQIGQNVIVNDDESLQNFSGVSKERENLEKLLDSAYKLQGAGPPVTGRSFRREQLSRDNVAKDASISSSGKTTMAAPVLQMPIGQHNNNNSFLQQQLLQTQSLFFDQQKTMNTLSASVEKIQKMLRKRKRNSTHEFSVQESDDEIEQTSSDSEDEKSKNYESGEISSDDDSESVKNKQGKKEVSVSDRKKQRLKNLELTFGKDSNFGPAVELDVASTVNKGLGSKLDHKCDAIKNLMDKYERPENCEYIDVPRVAKSIWTSKETAKELKDSDKLLQRTQSYLTKGLIPVVQIMNKTLNAQTEDAEEIFDLAVDAFSLLAYSHRDLSCQRKRLLTPAIASKYKGLCGDSSRITATQLFGDDLSGQIKEIEESGKITNKLTDKSKLFKGDKWNKNAGGKAHSYKGGYKNMSEYKSGSFLYNKGSRTQGKFHKKGNASRHNNKKSK